MFVLCSSEMEKNESHKKFITVKQGEEKAKNAGALVSVLVDSAYLVQGKFQGKLGLEVCRVIEIWRSPSSLSPLTIFSSRKFPIHLNLKSRS